MRTLVIFYVLVFYALIQFCWWAYLLIDLNTEIYDLKIAQVINEQTDGSVSDLSEHNLIKELHNKWIMIAGEGFVFLSLLVWGIFKTHRSFKKEIELARNQKNFLLSITHEIKSPLAAIKLNLETIRRHNLEESKKADIIQSAIEETNRMNDMMDNALAAVRIDTNSFSLSRENVCVSDLIHRSLRSKLILLKESRFKLNVPDEIYANIDQNAFTSILLNLVENAEKYSEGLIKITLSNDDEQIYLEVEDDGKGVAREEKELIFKKFYRIGNEETRNSKGTGLGLFIVKHLVQFHHGSIDVLDNKPRGTIFKISIPINGQ